MKKHKIDQASILIVDDSLIKTKILHTILKQQDYQVKSVENGEKALQTVAQDPPDLILLDIIMPVMDGFETCKNLKADPITKNIPIIFLTSKTESKDIIKAFQLGAADYVTHPFEEKELLARVQTHIKLQKTHKSVRIAAGIEDIIVISPLMQKLHYKALSFNHALDINVVIEGESGVGKEIIAKLIHYGKGNVNTPFIDINIASLTPSLFESELFGYESGAFTGARLEGMVGKMEMAKNGSLFLDEISDFPMELQPKLLRILEERLFYRIGGKQKRNFKARVICASNQNLQTMVSKKLFRNDLFHRLNVGYFYLPPLRERREEILPLAELFLQHSAKRRGVRVQRLSSNAKVYLQQHPWPGNIRELENIIETACILTNDEVIRLNMVLPQRRTITRINSETNSSGLEIFSKNSIAKIFNTIQEDELSTKELNLEDLNADIIFNTVKKFNDNKTQAAKFLGISRHSLHRRLIKMNRD